MPLINTITLIGIANFSGAAQLPYMHILHKRTDLPDREKIHLSTTDTYGIMRKEGTPI